MAITQDTKLYYQVGSSYTELQNVISVSTPDYAVKEIDSTVLTSDGEESDPGIEAAGKIGFVCKHNATNFAAITGLRGSKIIWHVLFSDGYGFAVTGYLSKVAAKADGPDKLLVLDCEVKCSGTVTTMTP